MKRISLLVLLTPFALGALAENPHTERLQHGKQVYLAACASCHDTGESGAPMLSRPEQWSERSELWEAVLLEHANKGYGQMPGEGGDASLQEYDVDAAAEYILSRVFPERTTD